MAVPKRFGVLRFVGTLFKVLAWIIIVAAIIAGILAGAAASVPAIQSFIEPMGLQNMFAGGSGLVTGILLFLGGLLYWFILYAAGESILMQVAIEENTRLTAALLLRMHQDSQVEADAAYSATYTGESYVR